MMSNVVPAIPAVALPDGPRYIRESVKGECSGCDRQAIAYVTWTTCEWVERALLGGGSELVEVPEERVGESCWACADHLEEVAAHRPVALAPGTHVTVELDPRWLALAGAGDLPTGYVVAVSR